MKGNAAVYWGHTSINTGVEDAMREILGASTRPPVRKWLSHAIEGQVYWPVVVMVDSEIKGRDR